MASPRASKSEEVSGDTDLFDAILSVEESNCERGYLQGQKAWQLKYFREGFSLGLAKGYEAGNEVAFYRAFAKTWSALLHDKPREKKVVDQLLALTDKCPNYNSKDDSLIELKQSMNAKFRQLCAVLKIEVKSNKSVTW